MPIFTRFLRLLAVSSHPIDTANRHTEDVAGRIGPRPEDWSDAVMIDGMLLVVIVGFFAVAEWVAAGCEALRRRGHD